MEKKKESKGGRMSSGVAGFDNLIEKGYDKESLNMIVGDSGSGKTIFALQFLIEGLKKNEKCLFVTFEEDKDEFYDNMKDFGWDLKKQEKKGNFFFLDYNPKKVKTMIEEGGGEIERLVVKHKIDRLVIDSLTSFLLLYKEEVEKREAALSLFDIIRRWNVTTLITLQEDVENEKNASNLEFGVDSLILIYFVRKNKERKRFVEVLKMRGTKHSTRIYPLETTKKGFKVRKKAVENIKK